MNILLLTKCQSRSRCISLSRKGIVFVVAVVFVALPLIGVYTGYKLSVTFSEPHHLSAAWEKEIAKQRAEIAEAKRVAQENLNALALRLGQMQAHVMRLDALGQRLTHMANLDNGEFDFERPPAQGGPGEDVSSQGIEVSDFVTVLDDLSRQLNDRSQQLDVLETMLINRNLQAEVFPTGRPAEGGWISSYFGLRTDPFSGKPEYHNGIDLAGREGAQVVAAASGVISWAGERYGYGQLVEVSHGNGYVTRYGHNKRVLVTLGQPVKKGQVVALMGSTGRSTGPHVHFEVLRDGQPVDPLKFVALR